MKRAFLLVLCILVISSCTQTRNRPSTYSQPKAASTSRKVVSTSTPAINKTTGDAKKSDGKYDTGHRKSVTPSPDVSGYYVPKTSMNGITMISVIMRKLRRITMRTEDGNMGCKRPGAVSTPGLLSSSAMSCKAQAIAQLRCYCPRVIVYSRPLLL